MVLHRRFSTQSKTRQDDEGQISWLGRTFSKLQRKRTVLKITLEGHEEFRKPITSSGTPEVAKVEDVHATPTSTGKSPRFCDESVEVMLRGLLATASPRTVLNCILVCKQWSRVGLPILYQANRTSQLPEEILLDVFERVVASPSGTPESAVSDLSSCASTCKQWSRIASPMLYQHFVLNVNYAISSHSPRYNFHPPCDMSWWTPTGITRVASWIQSLSIELHFHEAGPSNRMIDITNALCLLPNLTTFSLRAAPLEYQHYIVKDYLAIIVDALPSTVRNFELDTRGRDTMESMVRADSHLCSAISNRLAQFRHLRLRIGSMCPLLIDSLTVGRVMPNLESATFLLLNRSMSYPVVCCRPHQWSTEHRPPQKLLTRLRERVEAGCFPKARSIVFAQAESSNSTSQGMLQAHRWSSETRCWKMERMTIWESAGYVFYRRQGAEPIEKWVDGDAAWVEDHRGARKPREKGLFRTTVQR